MSPAPPGPPKTLQRLWEVWNIPFNVLRNTFTRSFFFGTVWNQLQTDLVKYFPF